MGIIMKYLPLALTLLAMPALAQQSPDPNMQAMGQEIMECTAAKVQFRAQALAAAQHEAAAVAKQKQDDLAAQTAVKAATVPNK